MKKVQVKNFEVYSQSEANVFTLGKTINESLFDKLTSMFTKLGNLFKDPGKIEKAVEATVIEAGDKAKKLIPKDIKPNETVMVVMGDGKNSDNDFSTAFTKLAELPDGSSLFQISGTSSPEMLKALAGSDKQEDLSEKSVMAIISNNGLEKGRPATMKLLKNVIPDGKDYVTNSLVMGAVPEVEVQKTLSKIG